MTECQRCGELVRKRYYAIDPAIHAGVWVCKECETRFARSRHWRQVNEAEYRWLKEQAFKGQIEIRVRQIAEQLEAEYEHSGGGSYGGVGVVSGGRATASVLR